MIKDTYKEFFKEAGIVFGFFDYLLLNKNIPEKTDIMISRVAGKIDSIISQIILLNSIENRTIACELDSNTKSTIIYSAHINLFIDISIIMNICTEFIIDTELNTEKDLNINEGKESLKLRYNLTNEEIYALKKEWYTTIEFAVANIIDGIFYLQPFSSPDDLHFQIKNNKKQYVFNLPDLSNSNGIIHSVSFFSVHLLTILQYLKTMVKCINIDLLSIGHYEETIESAKKETAKNENMILPEEYIFNPNNDEIYDIIEKCLGTTDK